VRELSDHEVAALAAVTVGAGATWTIGEGRPDAYLTIGTRRVAVDVATVPSRRAAHGVDGTPRLLFDRVARRFIDELQAELSEAAGSRTVVVTHTAPIRMAGRTRAELTARVLDLLRSTSANADASEAIRGNEIRIRVLDLDRSSRGSVVVFIHNPKSDAEVLLDVTQSLLEAFASIARVPVAASGRDDRWLVLVDAEATTGVKTYQRVFDQLPPPPGFTRVLLVSGGRRVESLMG
jgi:hypothetical protein